MIRTAAFVCGFAALTAHAAGFQYGAFADFGYGYTTNHPANHLWRSRGTTFHVNEADLNMAALFFRKPASDTSRWAFELTGQTGRDSEVFGFSASAPNVGEAHWLTHLGPTNVSYQMPSGVTLQGGIFGSLIGYDSLFAKDNFTYTRPWGADFTPYLMLGANAAFPVTRSVTATAFVVNGYWHLAHANDVPSVGGQIAWKRTDNDTLKQTVMIGPHQTNTSAEFWRYLSDTIYEVKRDRLTTAFEAIAGTERVDAPGTPRAVWIASQIPIHWQWSPRVALTIRPEVYWDRDGRTTLYRQTVKANTSTIEYRIPYAKTTAIVKLEHRIDDSRGAEGGFFRGDEALVPTQNLFLLGVILSWQTSSSSH